MKRFFALFAGVMLIASCSKGVEYKISLQNLSGEYKMAYLIALEDSGKCIDSVQVENGVATFEGQVADVQLAQVTVEPKNFLVPLVLDGEAVTMAYADGKANITTGSAVNMQMAAYSRTMEDFGKSYREFMQDVELLKQQREGNFTAEDITMLDTRYSELIDGTTNTLMDMLQANKDNLVPAYILSSRTSPLEEANLVDFMKEYKYADRPCLSVLRENIEALSRMAVGAKVTDVVMNDIKGKECHLTDFVGKGNYVLVDFWASWCGPCRREMPAVKAAYEKFHDKGFDIVGISLDDRQENWEKAVADLGITWTQLSDLKGWKCEAARIYGVKAIPCTVLFDGEGKVVAANLRGEALAEKLAELYK